jgi:hypothetical protein
MQKSTISQRSASCPLYSGSIPQKTLCQKFLQWRSILEQSALFMDDGIHPGSKALHLSVPLRLIRTHPQQFLLQQKKAISLPENGLFYLVEMRGIEPLTP